MVANFPSYEAFQSAVTSAAATPVLMCPPISGVQDFSVIAVVPNSPIVLRFDAAEEPATFATDFPNAIPTSGFLN